MSRYHRIHVTLRREGADHGLAANMAALRGLVALADQAPCEAFLVDAGDGLAVRAHAAARASQSVAEYRRERLYRPRHTYEEEQVERITLASDHQPPFLELVLAGGDALATWATNTCLDIHLQPDTVHCHTPLNQRLMRPNLQICHWLTGALAQDTQAPPLDYPARIILAGRAFVSLTGTLGLIGTNRRRLAEFGHRYLATYLSWTGHSPPEALRHRAHQISQAAHAPFGEHLDPLGDRWLRHALRAEPWFFVPESIWMQYHWFVASLGVPLHQELALTEALLAYSRDQEQ